MNEISSGPSRRDLLRAVGAAGGSAAVYAAATALGLVVQPAAAGELDLKLRRNRKPHVVVLGAGIGGLVAALELRKAGYDCTVLEASRRAGGRNLTLRRGDAVDELGNRQVCEFDDHPNLYFNAGPARIPGHHRAVLGYCRTLGVPLEIFVNENRRAWVQDDGGFGGRPVRHHEYRTDARGFIAELLAKSVSKEALAAPLSGEDFERLREFLRAYGDLDANFAYAGSARSGYASGGMVAPGVKKAPRDFADVLGTNFWRTYMHWGELADQAAPMMQPVGGMDRIVTALMGEVGEVVRLGSPVQEIRLQEHGVEVVYANSAGATYALAADYCLNSIPTHLVPGLRHNLPAPYARSLAAPGRGRLFKLAFQAERRFWEDDGIYGGISWTSQDITQIWYPPHGIHSDKGVILGAYAFDDPIGTRLARLSAAQRVELALSQGERIHPHYRRFVGRGVSVAWHRMNHMLGCSAVWSESALRNHFARLQNPAGRHYMMGDQISYHPGWQEGAIQSAYHALRDIDRREREADAAA